MLLHAAEWRTESTIYSYVASSSYSSKIFFFKYGVSTRVPKFDSVEYPGT